MKIFRSKAPLRISFAGGGTDVSPFPELEGGCVLNTTITKYVHGTLVPRTDGIIHIESIDFGQSLEFTPDEDIIYDGKLDLIKAVIRKFKGQQSSGFDLVLQSDSPPGSGLGSSSAIIVALVGLLKEFQGLPLTGYEIANLAYFIERKELSMKGGRQDHFAASFGGFNFIEFWKDHTIVHPIKMNQDYINELECNILLCYTGKTRLSDSIIDDQTKRYREGDDVALEGLRKQKEIAVEIKNNLLRGQFHTVGDLLHLAWEYKKKMSPKITTPIIDEIYDEARKNGAIGGKISGAGGGGYMYFYCQSGKKQHVADALATFGMRSENFTFEPQGLQTWSVES